MATSANMPLLSAPPVLSIVAANERAAIFETSAILRDHYDMLDLERFSQAVWERQQIHPPLLGNQIALPHARTTAVSGLVFAVARLAEPVPFGAEKIPVKLLFLFGVPSNCIGQYLAATALLVRILRDPIRSSILLSTTNQLDFLEALGTQIA